MLFRSLRTQRTHTRLSETNAGATGNLQTGNNAATDVGGNNQKGGNNNAGADNSDPQKSLTLDPSQVQTGLALDGQQIPANNQVASATSTNNCALAFLSGVRASLTSTRSHQLLPHSIRPRALYLLVSFLAPR